MYILRAHRMLSSEYYFPAHRAHSVTTIHPSYPFLLVVLCFWIWSLNPIMEITGHFECLNPWGLVDPSQHPTGRRKEQRRKKSESLYVSSPLFGILRMYHFAGKTQRLQVPVSLARAVNSVGCVHPHQSLANNNPNLCHTEGRRGFSVVLFSKYFLYLMWKTTIEISTQQLPYFSKIGNNYLKETLPHGCCVFKTQVRCVRFAYGLGVAADCHKGDERWSKFPQEVNPHGELGSQRSRSQNSSDLCGPCSLWLYF